MIQIYLIFLLIFFTMIYLRSNYISKLVNLYDYPDKKRKLHKKPTPLIGGFIFLFFLIFFYFFSIFFNFYIIDLKTQTTITIACLIFFFLGYIDDKYEINAFHKLILQFVISIIFFYFLNENLIIYSLKFESVNLTINVGNYSLIFTSLCLVVFLNALNMFDGQDGQVSIYITFVLFLLLIMGIEIYFCLGLLIFNVLFLLLNLQKKTFLGDNGVFLIGSLVSFLIIIGYKRNLFLVDEIFIIMILPGIDMLRLFIVRSLQKRSPFSPDRQHFHHYIQKKFSKSNSLVIISFLGILPFVIHNYFNIIYSLIFFILSYSFLIFYSRYKN